MHVGVKGTTPGVEQGKELSLLVEERTSPESHKVWADADSLQPVTHMRQLFQRLREADLKLNREKCNFFKSHIQYLGHLISGEGIKPLPEKLESIKGMPPPTSPKEVKQFLGLIGYYRKFVPRFADIARSLTNLT